MAEAKRVSALDRRVREGKADPITDEERLIVAEIRASYERRFPNGRLTKKPASQALGRIAS